MTEATHLLDTNILSNLLRNPKGVVYERISALGEAAVCTSIIIACELRFGAVKRRSPKLTEDIDGLLERIEVVTLGPTTDRHYAEIRAHLERAGTPISPNDLLIAAHARALGVTLVTNNITEFQRVPGLAVENWLAV